MTQKKTTPKKVQTGPTFNRQQRRGIVHNKKSLSEMSSQVTINCKEGLDPVKLYNAILESIRRRTGEIRVIVERDGKSNFTLVPIDSLYDGIEKMSTEFSDDFNQNLSQQIKESEMSPDEKEALKKERIEQQKAAYLGELRKYLAELNDSEYIQKMRDDLAESINKLENPEDSGANTEQCQGTNKKVS